MDASPPVPLSSAPPLPPSGLVGRERERQRLGTLLAAAAACQGCLVLIGGEAGIGKTALVRAVASAASARGAVVLTGGCYDLSATPPYGPWREALAGLPSDEGLPQLPAALTDAGDEVTGGEAALFRQVLDILTAAATDRPVVLMLEDLHWADPASLDLLRFVGRQLASLSLLLVATYRADEVTRLHPLAQLLPTLVREAPTERLDLRRLDETALRSLVSDRYALPVEAEGRLVAYLQRAAEGNPFYAQELLRSLEEERVLCPGDPLWSLGNLARLRVPALLQQVVEGRLARLGEAARDHLAVAAVIGQRVPLAVWQAAGGLSEDDVLLTVDRAVEARLLEAGEDGSEVAFAHALVREVLYESVLPPRRRVWHRRAAEALADAPAADPDAVAHHFARAGDARAVDWLVRAGERAQRAYAWLTARDRFAAAVALLEGDAARTDERGWLLYRLGRLLRLSDPAQGVAYLEEAERVAGAIGDPVLAAYTLFDRGNMQSFMTADVDLGMAAMAEGLRAIEALPADFLATDPAVTRRIIDAQSLGHVAPRRDGVGGQPHVGFTRSGTMAEMLADVGRYAEARAVAEQYLAAAAPIDSPDTLALYGVGAAEIALAAVEAAMGRPTEARAACRRAGAAYRAIGHHIMAAAAAAYELQDVVLPYRTTDLATRRSLVAQHADEWARAASALPPGMTASTHDLEVRLLEGAWHAAEKTARPVLNTALPLPRIPRELAALALAALARWRGQLGEAWGLVRSGLPQGPATEPGGHHFLYAVALQRLAVELALDAGDVSTAAAWLATHDAWLGWSGAVRGQAEGRRLWARYHRVTGNLDRARQVASEAVAEATTPRQPLVLLAAHRLLGELETEDGRLAEAELHLGDALTLADACAAPFERALTLLALADLRAAEGKIPEATRLLSEVRAVGEPLGAAPLLARADALAARLAARPGPVDVGPRLSARETEVMRLVAAGRSNPEIAQDLSISPRTVTTHLTHIFAKLGVEGRAEAAAFAIRSGLI